MLDHDLTLLGTATWRHASIPFGIKRPDRRLPMYLLGKTGMGKSTLLANIVLSDIRAGAGVAVIDPHGALVETILHYIPDTRVTEVIYINPKVGAAGMLPGTQEESMTPGTNEQHYLAGALHLATGKLLYCLGPRKNNGVFRDL